jgi:hypothetical protein
LRQTLQSCHGYDQRVSVQRYMRRMRETLFTV